MHVAEIATREVLEQFKGGEIILISSSGSNVLSKGVLEEIVDVNSEWTRVLVTVTHHGVGTIDNIDRVEWHEPSNPNRSPAHVILQSDGVIDDNGRVTFDNNRAHRRSKAVITRA